MSIVDIPIVVVIASLDEENKSVPFNAHPPIFTIFNVDSYFRLYFIFIFLYVCLRTRATQPFP
jgi:hypothetical protein